MGRLRRHLTLLGPFGSLMTMGGCTSPGAPSLILFGAYFPGWILCAVAGIVAAIVARIVMVMSGLSNALPLQLFVCIAVGLLVAVAAWLFWFGQ
jgi:YtcA family